MEAAKAKMPFLKQLKPRTARRIAAAVLLVLLVTALCITTIMRSNIQRQYTAARNEVGGELYNQLYLLCQTFDQVDVPGQNVQDNLLPAMLKYYAASRALNDAVAGGFGERYALLSGDDLTAFDAAFDAYDAAFRSGRSTDNAKASLRACVETTRSTLSERFDGERLKPGK